MALFRPSLTMATLEEIGQELAQFQLKTLPRLQGLESALAAEVKKTNELEARIKELEDARRVQRSLNATFAVKVNPINPLLTLPQPLNGHGNHRHHSPRKHKEAKSD